MKSALMMAMAALLLGLACAGGLAADTPRVPDTAVIASLGLSPEQVASYDMALCKRLIRQGKVYLERGRYLEAKQRFWMAVLVDPTSRAAWRNYDIAVIYLMADKVMQAPGLVGVPGSPETLPGGGGGEEEPEEEEGC